MYAPVNKYLAILSHILIQRSLDVFEWRYKGKNEDPAALQMSAGS